MPSANTLHLPAALQRAATAYQSGNLDEAERLCQAILSADADYFDALHLLGVIEAQRQRYEAAVQLIGRALRLDPQSAAAHSNLGIALSNLNRPEDALASFDRALAIRPQFAEALSSRGDVLRELKRPEDALASLDRALAIRPQFAEALSNRGIALRELDRPEDALASFDWAIAIRPDYAQALNNRGNILRELKRPEDALASFDRAITIRPGFAEALNNRGNILRELKRPEDALASFDRALAIRPQFAEALSNRGIALRELKQPEDALASLDRALAIRPDYAQALSNRGDVFRDLRRHEDAAEAFARLLAIQPDYDYARGFLLDSQLHCCDWAEYANTTKLIVADVTAGKRTSFPFPYLAESAAQQLQFTTTYVSDQHPASRRPLWQGERYRHDRIRIAYLSADFHDHATAYLMAELFEAHDKARFDVSAISFGPDANSEMRERLTGAFGRFVDVRQTSDRDAALLLRELEIDIAVDLKGHTTDGRAGILAHRAAPIQVNYLGYPGTMGADYIDYIIADRWVIPQEHQPYYTEQVVYLPDTYQVNDGKRKIAEYTPTRAEAGLPQEGFVFCCFNNNYKITPRMFDLWMRLLKRVEGSVLWLLEDSAAAARNLRREAAQRGVAPERLVFAARLKLEAHLARQKLADLFVDTLPINAHTTASDALWVGLPVLTCLGQTFAGRVAASLLEAIGLPELITRSMPEYEALALKLATIPPLLGEIKAKLTRNRATHALFDTDRYRRHIEAAYVGMWDRYQRGEPPASFAVQPMS